VKNYLVFFHLSPFGELPVNTNSLIRYYLRLDRLRNHDAPFELVLPSTFNLSRLTLCVRCCHNRVDGNGGVNFDVMFGPAYKGIPLGAVVCGALYSDYGIDVGFAYNRKEAKDHGEGGNLVGASMEGGKRVLVIDDVITAGTAIRESHAMLSTIGAKMVGVVIALDRAEKRSLDDPLSAVQAVKRDLEVSVISIVNLPQLQIFLEKSPDYGEDVLKTVSEYRSQYGV
jgi:orotate phosphoribosyltransferase